MKGAAGVLAVAALAQAAPFEIRNWAGALRASIWDGDYDRGLGATGGAEARFPWGAGFAQLGYSYFHPRYAPLDAVHEVEAIAGSKWEFHPEEKSPVYPRLGWHAGVSFNWEAKPHFVVGVDAEGVVPLRKKTSLFAAFQPGYSLGAKNRMFWRVALGALFHVKP
jgi:hypothetical protein